MKNIHTITLSISLMMSGLSIAQNDYFDPTKLSYEALEADNSEDLQPFKKTSGFIQMIASDEEQEKNSLEEEDKSSKRKRKRKQRNTKQKENVIEAEQSYTIPKTIVDLVKRNSNLSSLAQAMEAATLTKALSGRGPFTLFAPTNEAFAKLPAGSIKALSLPQNKEALISILTYHVVPQKLVASSLKSSDIKTLQGSRVTIFKDQEDISINGAKIVNADNTCPNGVIHEIDSLMIPDGIL